jgi:hypothetical protein
MPIEPGKKIRNTHYRRSGEDSFKYITLTVSLHFVLGGQFKKSLLPGFLNPNTEVFVDEIELNHRMHGGGNRQTLWQAQLPYARI